VTGEKLKKQIAAFFDLDLTITDQDSFKSFLQIQYLYNVQNWPLIPYLFLWGFMRKIRIISLRKFKEKSLFFLKGCSDLQIEDIGKTYFEGYLIHTIRKNAIERVAWHNKKGHFTYIISASPDIYLSNVTDFLKCNGYGCTKLLFKHNRFTGKLNGPDCLGGEKKERIISIGIKEHLDLTNSYAYSDHESDLPFLETVGHPIVVSPSTMLHSISMDREWQIERW